MSTGLSCRHILSNPREVFWVNAPQEPTADWIETLKRYLQPDWNEIVAGEWAANLIKGTWSTDAIRGWCLQLYPFIHAFPKFLAEALIKAEDEIRAPS